MEQTIDEAIIALRAAKLELTAIEQSIIRLREQQTQAADNVGMARQRLNEAVDRREQELR